MVYMHTYWIRKMPNSSGRQGSDAYWQTMHTQYVEAAPASFRDMSPEDLRRMMDEIAEVNTATRAEGLRPGAVWIEESSPIQEPEQVVQEAPRHMTFDWGGTSSARATPVPRRLVPREEPKVYKNYHHFKLLAMKEKEINVND